MYTLNLIKFGRQPVSFYLALEKYLLNSPEWRDKELFFIWDIFPAIVCGRHQLIEGEVNMEYVKNIGVKIYRRHSGGGTIYADEGCFMFTFLRRSDSRDKVFHSSLSQVADAFKKLNLDVELSGRNDLPFKGKKFSGNSYLKNEFGSILHGTLMYNTDIETLVRCITPDNEKLISKGIESVRQRVINVGESLNISREELMRHLEQSIAPQEVTLADKEFDVVRSMESFFLSDEWMKGNNPPYTFCNKKRYPCGVINAKVDVKKDVIQSVFFNGDFFTHGDLEPFYRKFVGIPFNKVAVSEMLSSCPVNDYILGAENENIIDLLFPN